MVGLSMACYTKRHQEEFEAFRRAYRKNYATEEEYLVRCLKFAKNLDEIDSHNDKYSRGVVEWTMGVNEFSDLSNDEFLTFYTGFEPSLDTGSSKAANTFNVQPNMVVPTELDYSKNGIASPVKNQGKCGSCYAFATVAGLESQYNLISNKRWSGFSLSEQDVMECTHTCGNQKCQGGLMTNCYECKSKNRHGIMEEHHYPYISADGNNGTDCKHIPSIPIFFIESYYTIASDELAIIQALVLHGCIPAGMNANPLQNYNSGIFDPLMCSGILRNHAVTICGYSTNYWIIKNSWGQSWGEGGYFRMKRGKNLCGINGMCSFGVMKLH